MINTITNSRTKAPVPTTNQTLTLDLTAISVGSFAPSITEVLELSGCVDCSVLANLYCSAFSNEPSLK